MYYGYDTDEDSENDSDNKIDYIPKVGVGTRQKNHKQTVIKRTSQVQIPERRGQQGLQNIYSKPIVSDSIEALNKTNTHNKIMPLCRVLLDSLESTSTNGSKYNSSVASDSSDMDDYRSIVSHNNSSSSSQYHSTTEPPFGSPALERSRPRFQVRLLVCIL